LNGPLDSLVAVAPPDESPREGAEIVTPIGTIKRPAGAGQELLLRGEKPHIPLKQAMGRFR
jgi:hypothetical protein